MEIEKEAEFFQNEKPIDEIVKALFFFKNIPQTNGKILIFIDEIQYSPRAVKMLRYFYENYSELYLIAAGSLFEIMLENKQISFPVGRVQFLYMYPSFSVEIPIAAQINRSPKLQLFDTGSLNYFAGLQKHFFKFDNLHAFYRGILAEHIVMQEIIGYDMTTARKPHF